MAACTKAYFGEIQFSPKGTVNTSRSFMICIPHKHYLDDYIQKNGIERQPGVKGEGAEYLADIWWDNLRERH
jgi:hypothetical protein